MNKFLITDWKPELPRKPEEPRKIQTPRPDVSELGPRSLQKLKVEVP